jgi:hypothetical protein
MGSICKTCTANNFVPTEPFPTILSALGSLSKHLSIDILHVQIRPEEAENEYVNKETGNFRFLFPRTGMKAKVPPLES